jgi:hypothetical protein
MIKNKVRRGKFFLSMCRPGTFHTVSMMSGDRILMMILCYGNGAEKDK